MQTDLARNRALVRRWLHVVAVLVAIMVVLGGATRLTDSGLSITEWQPIIGAIPPLSEAAWLEVFERYRQIPQYQLVNRGMSLEEFKFIFWWEWAHRFLGRLIGVVVFVPMVVFFWRGAIERGVRGHVIALFLLGGLQGAIGWWMVASGLVDRVEVSQYRLAVHLTLAFIIFGYTVWLASGLTDPARGRVASPPLRNAAVALMALVLVQIFLGGLLAGLNGGLVYNSWPLMDGRFVPSGIFGTPPHWTSIFEDIPTVQFLHRTGAYIVFAAALAHLVQARRSGDPAARKGATMVLHAVILQAIIGIVTLLMVAPLWLALLHQFGAVVLLFCVVLHLRGLAGPIPAGGAPAAVPAG